MTDVCTWCRRAELAPKEQRQYAWDDRCSQCRQELERRERDLARAEAAFPTGRDARQSDRPEEAFRDGKRWHGWRTRQPQYIKELNDAAN